MATYEIVRDGVADTVTGLPAPAEVGEVIFFEDSFWRVDAIEEATSDIRGRPAGRQLHDGRATAAPSGLNSRGSIGAGSPLKSVGELAPQPELCLPRLVSSPGPGGSIDGLRAVSRNPGRRASPTSLLP